MLYDNALLARTYLHAWQVTDELAFKRVTTETLDFITREMMHPEGGFYSSLDADSEGEEGKFYTWTLDEIRTVLKNDSEFFETAYGINSRGNWDGKTVLQRAMDDSSLAARFRIDPEIAPIKLSECHSKLLSMRGLRIRPRTDDKVLTSWNGLMLATLAEAARLLSENKYLGVATRNGEFLLSEVRPNGQLRRAWRDGKVTNEVFLEDYAALIAGLLELYQTDFDNKWFTSAKDLADEMVGRFIDEAGGFFDTPKDGETLLVRPKDLQDNATPSGNALACEALLKLAALTDNGEYRDIAEKSLSLVGEFCVRYPTSFSRWLSAAEFALSNGKQIAVLGDTKDQMFRQMIQVIRSAYRPNVVVAASSYPILENAPSLLGERHLINGEATAYVCEGFVCNQPTIDLENLRAQLES